MRISSSSVLIGVLVVAAHQLVLMRLIGESASDVRIARRSATESPLIVSIMQYPNNHLYSVPLPALRLHTPPLEALSSPTQVNFDDPEQGNIADVLARASAPHVTAYRPNVDDFARMAGLVPGQSATVVVTVEVLTTGSVGVVSVKKSSGNVTVDAAALDYARAMHWIPGSTDRRAHVTRINFAITLYRTA